MSASIKPCPFCGSKPKLLRNRAGGLVITCNSLDCEQLSIDGESESEADDHHLIEAWNRRTLMAALEAHNWQLREALKFYADRDNHEMDGGKRARAALAATD